MVRKNALGATRLPVTYQFDEGRQRILKEMCTTHLPLQPTNERFRYSSVEGDAPGAMPSPSHLYSASASNQGAVDSTEKQKMNHLNSRGTASESGLETAIGSASVSKMAAGALFPPVNRTEKMIMRYASQDLHRSRQQVPSRDQQTATASNTEQNPYPPGMALEDASLMLSASRDGLMSPVILNFTANNESDRFTHNFVTGAVTSPKTGYQGRRRNRNGRLSHVGSQMQRRVPSHQQMPALGPLAHLQEVHEDPATAHGSRLWHSRAGAKKQAALSYSKDWGEAARRQRANRSQHLSADYHNLQDELREQDSLVSISRDRDHRKPAGLANGERRAVARQSSQSPSFSNQSGSNNGHRREANGGAENRLDEILSSRLARLQHYLKAVQGAASSSDQRSQMSGHDRVSANHSQQRAMSYLEQPHVSEAYLSVSETKTLPRQPSERSSQPAAGLPASTAVQSVLDRLKKHRVDSQAQSRNVSQDSIQRAEEEVDW